MQTTRPLLLTTAILAAASVGAAPASADSIAFVKNGNVHLTAPDGSATVAVTTAGGYSSVSQADDGRMIALHGKRFHLLSRWGDVLADFSPVADGTAGTITLSGPFDPAISPDGTRVAYGFYVQYKSGDPNCGKPGGCQMGQLYAGTGYSKADGPVEWSEAGYQPQYSWTEPSWIDNSRTLLSSPTSALVKQTAIDTAGDGQDAMPWFSDNRLGNLGDGELNRQGTAAAFIGNTQGDRLLVYRTGGAPQANTDPIGCLDAPASGGRWSSPSWSPDGGRLAFAGAQGIYVAELTGIADTCPDASKVAVKAFEPGATSPDWGPADLPGPKPVQPGPRPNPIPGPNPTPEPNPTPGPAASRTLTPTKTSLRSARLQGVTAKVSCTGSERITVTATKGKKPLGSGRATCRNGQASVKVKLSTNGRKALRGAKSAQLTLTTPGAAPVTIKLN